MRKFFAILCFAFLSGFSLLAAAADVQPAAAEAAVIQSIDINTADASALREGLLGVGEVKAQAIVQYREEHGPFASVDELLEVKGIGSSILERNRDRLSVR